MSRLERLMLLPLIEGELPSLVVDGKGPSRSLEDVLRQWDVPGTGAKETQNK